MKFRLRITMCMIWLLALAFGIGGSLIVTLGFSHSFDRETESALRATRMVLNTLKIVDQVSPGTEHVKLAEVLGQMSGQNSAGWSALKLSSDGETLFEDNSYNISLDIQHQAPEGQGLVSVVRDGQGRRHMRISAALSATYETLYLDICYDISGIYEDSQAQVHIYRQVFAVIAVVGGLLCWAIAYWVTQPISALSAASKRFASGDLSYRAKVINNDEIGKLTEDFNTMAEKLEDNIHAIQDAADRQKTFMGNFAHEMKNPMTSIIGYAELIRSQTLTESEQMDAANYIFSEGKRLESLSFKLLDLLVLEKKEIELVPARPAQIVGGMVEHLKRVYEEKGIVLQCRCEEGECLLEPDLVKSLLVNILDNSRKAMDKGGNIYIMSEMTEEGCRIRVLDTGRGIPEEEIGHITEAFYRVDKSRSRAQGGVGLGLSLCNEIVRLHNGTMSFASRVGNGTCVTVELKGGRV